MKIPKTFQLYGKTIKIEYNNKSLFKDNFLGSALYRESKIELQPTSKDYPIDNKGMEQTFYHELVHWILHSMAEHEQNKDEKYVDTFGSLLHQALTSMKN